MPTQLTNRFIGDLRGLVRDNRNQTQQQRAREGWPGPEGAQPLPPGTIWAKVQSGHVNFGFGDGEPAPITPHLPIVWSGIASDGDLRNATTVSVKRWNTETGAEEGDAFDVPIPTGPRGGDSNVDCAGVLGIHNLGSGGTYPLVSPAFFPGDVIALVTGRCDLNSEPSYYIRDLALFLDDPGGFVKFWPSTTLPRGWSVLASLVDRVPVVAGNDYSIGQTGNFHAATGGAALDACWFGINLIQRTS